MVNPDADGRSWARDEAEEPWRCCGLHSPARSHDWHWVQLPPRLWGPQAQPLGQCLIRTSVMERMPHQSRGVLLGFLGFSSLTLGE